MRKSLGVDEETYELLSYYKSKFGYRSFAELLINFSYILDNELKNGKITPNIEPKTKEDLYNQTIPNMKTKTRDKLQYYKRRFGFASLDELIIYFTYLLEKELK